MVQNRLKLYEMVQTCHSLPVKQSLIVKMTIMTGLSYRPTLDQTKRFYLTGYVHLCRYHPIQLHIVCQESVVHLHGM